MANNNTAKKIFFFLLVLDSMAIVYLSHKNKNTLKIGQKISKQRSPANFITRIFKGIKKF